MGRLSKDVAGNAGVLFVAAEVSRRGLTALPTIRNTEGVDLIAAEPRGGRSVAIQVKTSQLPAKKWVLTRKNETLVAENLFYVFVNLGLPDTLPEYHVVPSSTVAATIKQSHDEWLGTPGRAGRTRQDSDLRNFWDKEGRYLDAWDVLGLTLVG